MASAHRARDLEPDHPARTAAACCAALAVARDADWSVPARGLEWSCQRTLQHMAEAQLVYASHLACRATERRPILRGGEPLPVADLLQIVATNAILLTDVILASPSDARGWHPAGMADWTGFAGMSCTELVIHTADIAAALGVLFQPTDDLAWAIVARLFPWAPAEGDGWAVLEWACGRRALPDRERLGPDWYWHSPPLAEWDGTVKKRVL